MYEDLSVLDLDTQFYPPEKTVKADGYLEKVLGHLGIRIDVTNERLDRIALQHLSPIEVVPGDFLYSVELVLRRRVSSDDLSDMAMHRMLTELRMNETSAGGIFAFLRQIRVYEKLKQGIS